MNVEDWGPISNWFNAWLSADTIDRDRLREGFLEEHPTLATEVAGLANASHVLPVFLETPAFALAIHDLADQEPSLATGTSIGPYLIVHLLARGGMGDVYRATDVRLGRDVAIKLLARTNDGEAQVVERFVQEGRIAASLDHPNIVKVFDVGIFDGRPYIVAELLDGETLRDRIARGPLAVADALDITRQVANGLVAAHATGLVHRDLKPENIFLTRGQVAKILDFGIAKLDPQDVRRPGVTTVTRVVLGTASYLSPEQIRDDAIDARADLFTLGTILFEMLTTRRPFARAHTVDTLHAILHDPAPTDLAERSDVPPALASIVARLLQKAPEERFQSAVDLAWALEYADGRLTAPIRAAVATHASPLRPWRLRIAAVLLVATVSLGIRVFQDTARRPAPTTNLTRFAWSLPEGIVLDSPPLASPDGRQITFTGRDTSGSRLFVRSLDSENVRPVDGTSGAKQPFWSPDGRAIGFFAQGKLFKVALAGGSPVVLADAPDARGGTWSSSGTIVFSPDLRETALDRVSAEGGAVKPATLLDWAQDENAHRWPTFLPDGTHFLYFVRSAIDGRRGVYVGRIDRPATLPGSPLLRSESEAVYAPIPGPTSGALLYVMDGKLQVRPFDATHQVFTGDARTLGLNAAGQTPYHPAMFSVSADVLALTASTVPWGNRLEAVDRDGRAVRSWAEREIQNWPRISPDGRWIARQRVDAVTANPDIWVEDLARGTRLRATTTVENDVLPVWSPDSRFLAYRSGRTASPVLRISAADGTGVLRTLPCPAPNCEPTDWSPDGSQLIVNVYTRAGEDVWAVSAAGPGASHPILAEPYSERDARISPNGRWIAYVSTESGRPDVSVRTLSGPSHRVVVSSKGGDQPVWSRDGKELFFVNLDGHLRAVPVRPGPTGGPAFGPTVELDVPVFGRGHWGTVYHVSPDGRTIYFLSDAGNERPPNNVNVLLGWSVLFR